MVIRTGLTYNDVLLVPKRTPLQSRSEADLHTLFTKNIPLNIPLVSSNMASVTEHKMAIAMARNGGLGVIHQFGTIEEQVEEVRKVKKSTSYVIEHPLTVQEHITLGHAVETMKSAGVTSLLVLQGEELVGIFTSRDYLFETDMKKRICDVMTPKETLVTAPYGISLDEAKVILHMHRIEKLPLLQQGRLLGLITTKDIMKIESWPYANRDTKGRLRVGAAVGVKDTLERAEALIAAGVDVLVLDIAHAHSDLALQRIRELKANFSIDVMAGNIATAEAAKDLIEAGADGLKVGIGPGCFAAGTRILMANALYKNIEEVKEGDRVINMHGKAVSVKRAFCTGIRNVTKMRNSIFYETTYLTPDHTLFVGDLNTVSVETLQSRGYAMLLEVQSKTQPKSSKYKWKAVADLKQDVLLMPRHITFDLKKDFEIVLKKRSAGNWRTGYSYAPDVKMTASYDLGYIFGTFLGDGHAHVATHKGSTIGAVGWTFNVSEEEIAQKVVDSVSRVFHKECHLKKKENVIEVFFYYKPFADFLKEFGKRDCKGLPPVYLVQNKDYLQGLFDGLVDSDGHIEKGGRITFTNTSRKLIELFGVLNYLLTGVFSNAQKKEVGGSAFYLPPNLENFKSAYVSRVNTSGLKRLTKDYQAVKLLECEETNLSLKVYDLEIDCPTHSFIANNMIVHNSMCTTRVMSGSGMPQLTAVMDVYSIAKQFGVPVCADGGLKYPGDITKALAAGATSIFSGSFFAGTDEAPGFVIMKDGKRYKRYMGSASYDSNHERKENQEGKKIKEKLDVFVEGVATLVDYKGPVEEVIKAVLKGLQSGLSYAGAYTIPEMQEKAEFIHITPNGWEESISRGTKISE